jgi:hypothetical protein
VDGMDVTEVRPSVEPAARYRYHVLFRDTESGTLLYPIPICERCLRVINPVLCDRCGRTHRGVPRLSGHGHLDYEHEHPLFFLFLERWPGGCRSHHVEGPVPSNVLLRRVVESAVQIWEWFGYSHRFVERKVRSALRAMREG